MSIAKSLGERIAAFTSADVPDEALRWARIGIIDTIGVTLAGSAEPCARIARTVAAPSNGAALVVGTRERMKPSDAALVNGTAAHALDFDDCSNTLGGHPSARSCRRCSRSRKNVRASGRRSSPLTWPASKRRRASRMPSIFTTTTRAGIQRPRSGYSVRAAASAHLLEPGRGADGDGLGDGRVVRLRYQGQFRHHDEAVACRPCIAQRLDRDAAGARRFHRRPRSLRARQGFLNVYNGMDQYDAEAALTHGAIRSTSSNPALRSSSIRVAAARTPRSTRC